MDRPPLLVSPYDAELFGHWWYEGPEFLDCLVRKAVAERTLTEKAARTSLRVTSTQDYPRLKGAAALIAAPTFAAPRVA